MIRLRCGKKIGCGGVPGTSSLTIAPRSVDLARQRRVLGRIHDVDAGAEHRRSSTPPAASAPRCAAESTPRARPLTIISPRAARSAASRSATSSAYGERRPRSDDGDRRRSASDAIAPRIQSTGGGSTIAASAGGYAASLHGTTPMPPARGASIASRAPRAAMPARSARAGRPIARRQRVEDVGRRRRRRAAARRYARAQEVGRSERATKSRQVGHADHGRHDNGRAARPRKRGRTARAVVRELDALRHDCSTRFRKSPNGATRRNAARFRPIQPWHMACSFARRDAYSGIEQLRYGTCPVMCSVRACRR